MSPFGSSSLCVLRSKVQQCYDGFDGTLMGVRSQRHSRKFGSVNRALTGKQATHVVNPQHIPVIEFDYATDTPGPKISMMVATDLNSWINFCCCGKEKGGQDDYVIQENIDRLGLKRDQELSTLDVANAFI